MSPLWAEVWGLLFLCRALSSQPSLRCGKHLGWRGGEGSSGLAASSLLLHPLLSRKFPAWNWVPTEAHPVLLSWQELSQIPTWAPSELSLCREQEVSLGVHLWLWHHEKLIPHLCPDPMIFQLRKGKVDHLTKLQSQTKSAAPWKPRDAISLWNVLKCWDAFPQLFLPGAGRMEGEGSLCHKTACPQPARVWEETGKGCMEEKGGSPSIIPFFRQGIGYVTVAFLYWLHLGKEGGIKGNRTRSRDAGGISEIPNLVGHPMRAVLS